MWDPHRAFFKRIIILRISRALITLIRISDHMSNAKSPLGELPIFCFLIGVNQRGLSQREDQEQQDWMDTNAHEPFGRAIQ